MYSFWFVSHLPLSGLLCLDAQSDFIFPFALQGNKCVFNLCRGCCKKKAFKEVADCPSEYTNTQIQ